MGRHAPLVRDFLFLATTHDAHQQLTSFGLVLATSWSKDDLPPSGTETVYALVNLGKVHWVGRTVTLRSRISRHRSIGVPFQQVYYTECGNRSASNILECKMINRIRPIGNDKIPVIWLTD